ncbi:MAG: proton-conducting transporter membrane subunit [Nitrospinota bacterium]|nr:proton-conducting transporter membrane subunit [Nitrospinota bacterium]
MDSISVAVFFPFAVAVAVPYFANRHRSIAAWMAMLAPVVSLWALVLLYGEWSAAGRGALLYSFSWVPSAGLDVSFLVDGLSIMWGFLVAGVAFLIVLYSNFYLHEHEDLGRYYGWLIAFMGSMMGVVFADHLLTLFISWELTSVTSFFLIGFWSDREAALYGSQKALLITGGGGLAMLAGFLLLGQATGEWHLSKLIAMSGVAGKVSLAAFVLIILGAATKSAQWPFHIWLPNAMEAPTPISAFLHSATMVKAGIYLLSRFYPILGEHPAWGYIVIGLGMTTMIAGGLLSLRAYDLKAILAYGTISQLGLIVTFLGYGGQEAIIGSTLHLYNHAAAKAAMFMIVGIIDHETGTRDVRLLDHLARRMPRAHILAVLAAISLIGVPPMGGFLTKEMLYGVSIHPGGPGEWAAFWPWLTLAAGIITALYHLRFLGAPFWTPAEGTSPKPGHDPSTGFLAAPAILVALAIAFGVAPGLIEGTFVAPAAEATLGGGGHLEFHLALWHGVNQPLVMSIITVAAAGFLYWKLDWVSGILDAVAEMWKKGPGPNKAYDGAIFILKERTWPLLLSLQDGNLRRYLRWSMTVPALLLLAAALWLDWGEGIWPAFSGATFIGASVCILISISALATALFPGRLPAILALGTAGYAIASLYVVLKAPDLALTQIMIESASIILFLLAFWFLPEIKIIPKPLSRRARDWGIAIFLGASSAAGMALAMNSHNLRTIADYFFLTSKPIAGFQNVVNAIIVDYRGYDTLGEITVLVISGVAIHAMLRIVGTMQDEGEGH